MSLPDGLSASRGGYLLLLTLTVVAACTDAISYLGLHRVFPANMTRNTVLRAIGVASRDPMATARSATALGAFLTGAAVVGALASSTEWATTIAVALCLEAALLGALVAWWPQSGAASPGARYGLIALAGGFAHVAWGAAAAAIPLGMLLCAATVAVTNALA